MENNFKSSNNAVDEPKISSEWSDPYQDGGDKLVEENNLNAADF